MTPGCWDGCTAGLRAACVQPDICTCLPLQSSAPLADILAQQLKQRSVEPVLLGSCPGAAGQALQEPLAVLRQDLQKVRE